MQDYKYKKGDIMSRKNKIKIFKFIILILVISIFIGVISYLFPVMKKLSTSNRSDGI